MTDQSNDQSPIPETNFFAQFYNGEPEGLKKAPRPGLLERFHINMEAATRYGTAVGSLRDVSRADNRHRFDSRYESFPDYEGALEGSAALFGQLAGTMFDAENGTPHLENLVPIGLGSKAVSLAGSSLGTLRARVFAGAVDAAVVNAVTDAGIQGIEQAAGYREEFDGTQLLASTAMGAVAGGVMGPISHRTTPEAKLANEIEAGAEKASQQPGTEGLIDNAVRTDPMEAPEMGVSLPEGSKLDLGDERPLTAAKLALVESEGDMEPVALGDRLQPRPETQNMVVQDAPVWRDNGKWSIDDPDILEVGHFGPVVDINAHGNDWKKVTERLQELEAGEAPRALDHPEIGDIDLVWGDYVPDDKSRQWGFKKILEKHPEVVETLPDILRKGTIEKKGPNRVILVSGDKRSVIALDYMGEDKIWLLTSYEDVRFKEKQSQRDGKSILRSTSHQSDVSSGSLADTNISPKEGNIKDSQALDGTTKGSATGKPGQQDMRLDSKPGKDINDSHLSELIANLDNETQPFIQSRLGQMTGEIRRKSEGVERNAASNDHKAVGVRLLDLSNRLVELVDVAAVRRGIKKPLGQKKSGVLGTHHMKSGVIRLKDPNDFEVLVHEVGHHIDVKLGPDFKDLMVVHRGELEEMAYVGADPDVQLEEGFAEFFRSYITNPNFASKKAPRFNRAFTDYLKENKPDWLQGFVEMQDSWHDWITMPSGEAVSNSIVSSKKQGFVQHTKEEIKKLGIGQTIGDFFHTAYSHYLDAKHPIQQARDAMLKIYQDNSGQQLDLKVKDDPYKLARMMEGAQSAGHMDLMQGVHDYHSLTPEGPTLRDAMIFAHGGGNVLSKWNDDLMHEFSAYLWSRRALGERQRFEAGDIPNAPDKFTKGDHVTNIKEKEATYPHFRQAAEMVYQWNSRLWKKKLDAGLISQEQYRDGLKIRDYVPGLRKQDYPGNSKTEGKTASSTIEKPVKQFRGSNLDVINPLESLMADAYETAITIAHNDMIRSVKRLADLAGHGAGAIAEEIPAREMRALMVDPSEALEALAKEQGYSKQNMAQLRDALEASLGNEKATLFRPEVINKNGQPIVFYRENGQLKALRLADGKLGEQMFQMFQMMQTHERHLLTDILAGSASMMRTGITAAPEFIGANIIRDYAMSAIFYGKPLQRLKATASGTVEELLGRDIAKQYNLMGGIMGGENVASLRNGAVDRDLKALRKKGFWATKIANPVTHPYQFAKGMASITEISETANRIGLYKTFFEEAKLRGLEDFEAAMEAAYLARDHIDFDRRGLKMVTLSRIVPFLNASLQGSDKSVRMMIMPIAKKYMGKQLTPEDVRAFPQAVKAWARLAGLTVMGMTLHAIMSDYDDYHEISDTTRASHWMVKNGNHWFAIPKPFELAMVINLGEAMWDAHYRNDPIAYERYRDGVSQVLFPPNIMESNPIVRTYFEALSNKDFFTDRDIVPDQLKGLELHLQYTARTSELAKQLGEAMGWSPAMTEKMMLNFTGGLGRSALSIYDAFASNKPGQSIDDMAILRRFIKSASKGSRSVSQFWAMVAPSTGEFESKVKSYKAMLEAGDKLEAANYLATLSEEQRVYLVRDNLGGDQAKAKKLHPLDRARRAVRAISKLRKDLADDSATGADGTVNGLPRVQRGAIVDILETIAMKEARNALVLLKQPGWENRGYADISGHYRELEAINPNMMTLLADRYATGKVLPFKTVKEAWPDFRKRLLEEGTEAPLADLIAITDQGYELDGDKIPRKKKAVIPGKGN